MLYRLILVFFITLIIVVGYSCKSDPTSTVGDENPDNNPISQPGWLVQTIDTTVNLTSVFFTSTNHGFIVGTKGTLLKTVNGGTGWQKEAIGTTNDLLKVLFVDSLNGKILGSNKTYLQTTDGGTSWIDFSNGIQVEYVSFSFFDKNNGVAVGVTSRYANSASVFVTSNGGNTWELLSTIITQSYQPLYIHYEDSNNITVIGSGIGDTQVYKTSDRGNHWQNQFLTGTKDFSDASFIDSKNGFILAYHGMTSQYWGTLHKTTDGGLNWQQISDWKLPQSRAIYMVDKNIGYAVGNSEAYLGTAKRNAIYKTTNGGIDWDKQISNTTNQLNDVYFTDSKIGFIVGNNGTILRTTTGGLLKE